MPEGVVKGACMCYLKHLRVWRKKMDCCDSGLQCHPDGAPTISSAQARWLP